MTAHHELTRLRVENEQLHAVNRDLDVQLTSSVQLNGELLRTNVAFRRLLESFDSASALKAIEEILINIVGTEDFVILLAAAGSEMQVVGGMGHARDVAIRTPTIDGMQAGSARVVPMRVGELLVGVIVIGSLLPHRDALNHADEEVLELISAFAATAVMAADYRQGWTRMQVAGAA